MYTLKYNGFTLSNNGNYTIDTLTGISRVDVRRSEDFLTGGDGGNIWERKLAMRIINAGGGVYNNDISSYYTNRTNLMQAFVITNTNNLLTITRSDGVVRAIQAKVVEVPDITETAGEYAQGIYNLTLKCENPYFQDANNQTFVITPGNGGGTPVPMPVYSPIGQIGGTQVINNVGDTNSTAIFTIKGQILNPSVTNNTTGQGFTINANLASTDTVTVYQNTNGFFVLLNGNQNYYQYFTGTFFNIIPGSNTISFTGSSFNGATLTIQYVNYYLGF